jgi:hypothetical protein
MQAKLPDCDCAATNKTTELSVIHEGTRLAVMNSW